MTTDTPNPEAMEQPAPPASETPPPAPAEAVAPAAPTEPAPEAAPETVPHPEVPPAKEETHAEAETEQEEPEQETTEEPAAPPVAEAEPSNLHWYVVKVQSGREESIKESIERRVKIEALETCYGQILIPTEKVTEMRKGKRYIRDRKLLPGYIFAQVEFNDHMLYLFRETSGVGDFVGAGVGKKPIPMSENEIKKWVGKVPGEEITPTVVAGKPPFNEGDRVKVKDGMFAGMEGVVKQLLEAKGSVVVVLTIFGRPVDVELEYWQVDYA